VSQESTADAPVAETSEAIAAESVAAHADASAAPADGEQTEAGEVGEQQRKSKAKSFYERRQMERKVRELEQERAREREEAKAEREAMRAEVEQLRRWREQTLSDPMGHLQREGLSREELLAQQADEGSVPLHLRRQVDSMTKQMAEMQGVIDKRFRELQDREQQHSYESSIRQDVGTVQSMANPQQFPAVAALSPRRQAQEIERLLRTGRYQHAIEVLQDLDEEWADDVKTIRGAGNGHRETQEPRGAPAPKAPTRVGARDKAAPAAQGPLTESEMRERAIANLRARREERAKKRPATG
jgi:hypothetical protein